MKRSFRPTVETLEDRMLLSAAPVAAPTNVDASALAGQTVRIRIEAADASTAMGDTIQASDLAAKSDPFLASDPTDYSAIAFVGGWGASSYQYAFSGSSGEYNLDDNNRGTHVAGTIGATTYEHEVGHALGFHHEHRTESAIEMKGQKIVQNEPVSAGVCHGTTVLAWARVDGASPTVADDVIVDGRIITGENFDSAVGDTADAGAAGGGGAGKVQVHDISMIV